MATLAGKPVTANGLGLMRMTLRNSCLPDEEAFKVLKAALASGANVWNGADFYGTPDENSLHLMNRYFTKYPEDADQVVLCIKSGVVSAKFDLDAGPDAMRGMVENSNKILDGKKTIDIFGPARVDPNYSVEKTVEGLAQLVKEGKIGGIQLSEVKAETIRRAAKVAKIDMVEAEVSLWSTDIFENGVAEVCAELGIVVVGHTPLGAGMLTGQLQNPSDLPENDYHRMFPRFQGENFEKNLELVKELQKLAQAKSCSAPQLALAWIKSHNGKPGMPFIIPVAGARSESRVKENCADVDLSESDLEEINSIMSRFPVAGNRYPDFVAKLAEY
ncbi:hypothetical protein BP5796_08392 [Coleophoma crateriformis]|uniref:NADP-dependent oxidoreductase domain-containing protein n=1 Tax=Coleophoma crateriformis TaxID=565419 RepID=A0A3D8R7G6_9HELO|nr:hypothetical protein BP5796_08392 [Coleophoma crateriformis]